MQFVDAVVIGEAESIWEQVLADAVAGRLQPRLKKGRGWMPRNCPHRAATSSPTNICLPPSRPHGAARSAAISAPSPPSTDAATGGIRLAEILDELETIPNELLFFVDDNIIGYRAHCQQQALDLFQGMVKRGLKKKWFCQASLNVADDAEKSSGPGSPVAA